MRTARRILLPALLVAVLLGVVFVVVRPREPVHHGKRLAYYLDQLATNYPARRPDDPGLQAIYAMGPDAIPYLRHALRREGSLYERALRSLHARLPHQIARLFPDPKNAHYLKGLNAAAAEALAAFGPLAREALPDLIECLNDPTKANVAVYAVTQIGPQPENLPALLSLLSATNLAAPIYAITCIGRVGVANAEVLNALTKAAANQVALSPDVRRSSIEALGELGYKARSAETVLTRNLDDSESVIRVASAAALWKIQGKTNASVTWLVKALDDEIHHGSPPSSIPNGFGDHEVNLSCLIGVLREMGSRAEPAVPLLRKLEDEQAIQLRMAAAEALWRIIGETNRLVPIYLKALRYFDPNVRMRAASFLTEFCTDQHLFLPELEGMLSSPDSFARFHAARALWKLKGQTESTLPFLIAGLQDHFTYYRNAEIRQLAAETLAEMGLKAKPAVPALLLALRDGQPNVRFAATNALQQIDPEAAAKAGVR